MAIGTQSSSSAPPPQGPQASAADEQLLNSDQIPLIDQRGKRLKLVTDSSLEAELNAQDQPPEAPAGGAPPAPETTEKGWTKGPSGQWAPPANVPGLQPAGQPTADPDERASSFGAPIEMGAQALSGVVNAVGTGIRNTAQQVGGALGITKPPTHEDLTKPFVEGYEPESPLGQEGGKLVSGAAQTAFDRFEEFINGALTPSTWSGNSPSPMQEQQQTADIQAGKIPQNYVPPNLNRPTDPGVYAGGVLQLLGAAEGVRGGVRGGIFKDVGRTPPRPGGVLPEMPGGEPPPGGPAAAGGEPPPGGATPKAPPLPETPPPPGDGEPDPNDVYNTREATSKLPARRQALQMSPEERMAIGARRGLDHMRHSAVHMDIQQGATDWQISRAHDPAKEAFNHERNVMVNNAEQLIRNTRGTEGLGKNALQNRGKTIANAVDQLQKYFDNLRNSLYEKVKAHTGDRPYVQPTRLNALLGDQKFNNALMADGLLPLRDSVASELQRHMDRNVPAMSVSAAEEFRQWLNERYSRTNSRAIRQLKDALDQDVIGHAGEDYFQRARALSEIEHKLLHNPDHMVDLFDYDPRTQTNRATAFEQLPDAIATLPAEQFDQLMNLFELAPRSVEPHMVGAIREIQAHFANLLRHEGEKSPARPWDGHAVENFVNNNDANIERAFRYRQDLLDHVKDITHLGHINWVPTEYPGAAAQSKILLEHTADPAPPRVNLAPSLYERAVGVASHGTGPAGRVLLGSYADRLKRQRGEREGQLNEDQKAAHTKAQAEAKAQAQREAWERRQRAIPPDDTPMSSPGALTLPSHDDNPYGLLGRDRGLPPLPPEPPPPGPVPPPPSRPNTRAEQHLEDISGGIQELLRRRGGEPPEGAPPTGGGEPPTGGGEPPTGGGTPDPLEGLGLDTSAGDVGETPPSAAPVGPSVGQPTGPETGPAKMTQAPANDPSAGPVSRQPRPGEGLPGYREKLQRDLADFQQMLARATDPEERAVLEEDIRDMQAELQEPTPQGQELVRMTQAHDQEAANEPATDAPPAAPEPPAATPAPVVDPQAMIAGLARKQKESGGQARAQLEAQKAEFLARAQARDQADFEREGKPGEELSDYITRRDKEVASRSEAGTDPDNAAISAAHEAPSPQRLKWLQQQLEGAKGALAKAKAPLLKQMAERSIADIEKKIKDVEAALSPADEESTPQERELERMSMEDTQAPEGKPKRRKGKRNVKQSAEAERMRRHLEQMGGETPTEEAPPAAAPPPAPPPAAAPPREARAPDGKQNYQRTLLLKEIQNARESAASPNETVARLSKQLLAKLEQRLKDMDK